MDCFVAGLLAMTTRKRLEIPQTCGNDKPSMQPPLLPEEALARVLRLARWDGLGVLMLATFLALNEASVGDVTGAGAWLVIAGSGAMALHGVMLLREMRPRGLGWIVASQYLFLLAAICLCALRLAHFDLTELRAALTDEMKTKLAEANYDQEDFLRMVYATTYYVLGGIALIYKGGLAVYFQRRSAAVASALTTED
jgi:hypothetical protein